MILLKFTNQKLGWFKGFAHGKNKQLFPQPPYFYDCIFLDSLVILKHWLNFYLGYVANQSVFLYMKQ